MKKERAVLKLRNLGSGNQRRALCSESIPIRLGRFCWFFYPKAYRFWNEQLAMFHKYVLLRLAMYPPDVLCFATLAALRAPFKVPDIGCGWIIVFESFQIPFMLHNEIAPS
ncbi:hypothetical protein PsorP6_005788 [Peronosclerospora sorghi]|uniref:Uncharacterized protein n=1 Tax=Peronosclerospora sorghi TaxID=230839 RepID=A0ACC0W3E5_9STRA|nr:hypothetical protein PsorP6_005788 [Peronosclerospora sorghi]